MITPKLAYLAPLALVTLAACSVQDPAATSSPSKVDGALGPAPGLAVTTAPVHCVCECATTGDGVQRLCATNWWWNELEDKWVCPDYKYEMGSPANCGAMNNQVCWGWPAGIGDQVSGTLLACGWFPKVEVAEISSNEGAEF